MEDKKLLKKYGWVVECESPFEISNSEGSFASGEAAYIILSHLQDNNKCLLDEFKKSFYEDLTPEERLEIINEYDINTGFKNDELC